MGVSKQNFVSLQSGFEKINRFIFKLLAWVSEWPPEGLGYGALLVATIELFLGKIKIVSARFEHRELIFIIQF